MKGFVVTGFILSFGDAAQHAEGVDAVTRQVFKAPWSQL